MSDRFPYAVVHGRFQPFHREHMAYFQWAMTHGEHLVVGITNFDRGHIKVEPTNAHRHTRAANPFSYWERTSMIRDALLEAGLAPGRFTIVALPIDAPERWSEYVPTDPATSIHLLRIFSPWEGEKANRLRRAGCRVTTVGMKVKVLSASQVRARIVADEGWEGSVPPAVARWIVRNKAMARLRELGQTLCAPAGHAAPTTSPSIPRLVR